ncbi:NTF2 fold immunity protein [Kordia sp.]|uniref:NTF2 fold immunity protein n=1 Tax=Kordia sp. TaxID=1965332 RepID=UPI003B592B91
MKKFKTIIILLTTVLTSLISFGQETERSKITEKEARVILQESLSDATSHNVIGLKPLLVKEEKAIDFAERVLWDIYGKKNIEIQKPYNVFLIDEYWFLSGTLPKEMIGGTFTIIIDSRNYRVIRLTHSR